MKKKKIIIRIIEFIIILSIFSILIYVAIGVYNESQIRLKEEARSKVQIDRILQEKQVEENSAEIVEKPVEKVNIPKSYLGFEVSSQLIIPKINLETYVLKDYTKDRMDVCPTKFWGPDPNEIRKLLYNRS